MIDIALTWLIILTFYVLVSEKLDSIIDKINKIQKDINNQEDSK